MRLGQAAKILNITTTTIVQYLKKLGFHIEDNLNYKLTEEQYSIISEAFAVNKEEKEKSSNISIDSPKESLKIDTDNFDSLVFKTVQDRFNKNIFNNKPKIKKEEEKKMVNNEDFKSENTETITPETPKQEINDPLDNKQKNNENAKSEKVFSNVENKIKGVNVLGFIDISNKDSSTRPNAEDNKERAKHLRQKYEDRKRLINQARKERQNAENKTENNNNAENKNKQNKIIAYAEKKIKNTLARLNRKKDKNVLSKSLYRKEKFERFQKTNAKEVKDETILQVTENISLSDFAALLKITPAEVLDKCKELGIVASLHQRLNADIIDLLADEYGFRVEFLKTSFSKKEEKQDLVDEKNLQKRTPIVTIMGHVDHGKTSLLDYIRKTNITKGEEGGITQHIGAYKTNTKFGDIVFLDTPGHEAFTAMRVRGVGIADIVVIIIAADDGIQPQTREIISQVKLSGSHIIIAINKIDKEGANPDKIKEGLANLNILVEDWGGKYQCQYISAKTGEGVEALLEKIILEAETMDLKADAVCSAKGIVLESFLDKGRGFVNTAIVQKGKLKVGDSVVSGIYYGKVKALLDDAGKNIKEAGPSTPVQIIGLNGACKAEDKFSVESEKEAKNIAAEREQILRQQHFKTQQGAHVEENDDPKVKKINLIIKGDVYGSIQALADSLLRLQNEFVKINIISNNVGIVNDSDVNFAITAKASIICFNVKPSPSAKKLATQNKIEIKTYSLIYDAIEDMEELIKEMSIDKDKKIIKGRAEVKALFKITKVGMIAGCFINEGSATVKSKVQIVRDGNVVFNTEITQIKHYKSDIKEAKVNTECGIYIRNYNDYQIGDILECYEFANEVKKEK